MIRKFNDFEQKYNLFNMKLEDFELWVYIRFELYFAIGEHFGITNGVGSTPKTTLKDKLCLLWNTIIKNPYYNIDNYDVLIIPHQRRILDGTKYRCIYTDEIANHLSFSSITTEFLFGQIHYKPAKSNNIAYLDYIDVWPAIKYKILKCNNSEIKKYAQIIEGYIKEFFSVELTPGYIEKLIEKRYYWHKYKKPLLRKLLLKIKPKVIVEVVGYETNKMILNEVAHDLNIPCIELQHGVIGSGHIAYNYKINKPLKQFPSYLFVYSDYWKRTCSFPIGQDRIIPTGFPYLEEQVNKYPKKKKKGKSINIIIYSSTDSSNAIQRFTNELMDQLEKNNYKYRITYKLHPLEYNYTTDIWDSLKESKNVNFIDSPTKSLYELCSDADIQVGVKTTAVFEGLSYGLDTFILDTGAPDIEFYMGDLVKAGFAVYGKNAEDFIAFVKGKVAKKNYGQDIEDSFFTKNSLENISRGISKIISLREKDTYECEKHE